MSDFQEDGMTPKESDTAHEWAKMTKPRNEMPQEIRNEQPQEIRNEMPQEIRNEMPQEIRDIIDQKLEELPQPAMGRVYSQDEMDMIIASYEKTIENFEQIAQLFTTAFATALNGLGAVLEPFIRQMAPLVEDILETEEDTDGNA